MENTGYLTLDEFYKKVYVRADGTALISKSALCYMCKNKQIPCVTLGMKRRYFIPVSYVNQLLEGM